WIDSLFHSWDSFVIDAGGSVALILFDETITELEMRGQLIRTDKLHFAGSVTVSLLWWSHTFHTKRPLSDGLDTYGDTGQVEQQLAAAVTSSESYPNTYPGQVSLANVDRKGIWNAPEQSLTFVQKVVPLDMAIARFGGVPLPSSTTFALGPLAIEGQGKHPDYAQSQFAPAAFLDLDTDAALHAPAGELWPAGFVSGDEIALGDDAPALGNLDEITIDREQLKPKRWRYQVSAVLIANLRAPGIPSAPAPIAVLPPRFVAAAGMAPTSFGAAWATRGATLRRSEGVE
ncbi:MAG TPA: hypothetical protein VLT45_14025, partial [Kofleriaceae bacterium]|nr:hypothetical protein [Kofleriaceae bacterium]